MQRIREENIERRYFCRQQSGYFCRQQKYIFSRQQRYFAGSRYILLQVAHQGTLILAISEAHSHGDIVIRFIIHLFADKEDCLLGFSPSLGFPRIKSCVIVWLNFCVHCLILLYSFQFPHYLSFKFSDLHIILKKNKSTLHSESKLENFTIVKGEVLMLYVGKLFYIDKSISGGRERDLP
jgi:hypothetical protein